MPENDISQVPDPWDAALAKFWHWKGEEKKQEMHKQAGHTEASRDPLPAKTGRKLAP